MVNIDIVKKAAHNWGITVEGNTFTEMTNKTHPVIYPKYKEMCDNAKLPVIPICIYEKGKVEFYMNAICKPLYSDEIITGIEVNPKKSVLLIHEECLSSFSEIKPFLAHELGHISVKNANLHQEADYLFNARKKPLKTTAMLTALAIPFGIMGFVTEQGTDMYAISTLSIMPALTYLSKYFENIVNCTKKYWEIETNADNNGLIISGFNLDDTVSKYKESVSTINEYLLYSLKTSSLEIIDAIKEKDLNRGIEILKKPIFLFFNPPKNSRIKQMQKFASDTEQQNQLKQTFGNNSC